MSCYRYGPRGEAVDDAARLPKDFGALMPE